MPPKKPRQSEPAPSPAPAAPKKSRTSLPALPRSSPTKPSTKRKSAGSDDGNYAGPSKSKPTKAKVEQVKKRVKMDVEVDVEEEEEEEIEEQVEKTPVRRTAKTTAKETAAAARKGAAAPSKTKNTRRESSKGEDKIGEIYAAGLELVSDTSVKKRAETIAVTMDKLEKQLRIPIDQLQKMSQERNAFFKIIDALNLPIRAILEDRTEFSKSLAGSISAYGQLPQDTQAILDNLDKVQKAAVESGLRCIEDSQDYSSFTRGAKRFVAWTR